MRQRVGGGKLQGWRVERDGGGQTDIKIKNGRRRVDAREGRRMQSVRER